MTDAVITEYAGTRRNDKISRIYLYGSGGVRVLDASKNLKRLYRFDSASDIMTEHDPTRQNTILRRFVFDRMGMLEETVSFGSRPRTFHYEQGCERIAVREGGVHGQVGKIFTFEANGIAETGLGCDDEIERVFIFEPGNDTITERTGGWGGNVERTIFFKGINASLFREPEAFLQFFIFTEWSARDRENALNEQVAKIRSGNSTTIGRNPHNGERKTSGYSGMADAGIEFIPYGGSPVANSSFEERWHQEKDNARGFSPGRCVEIPLEERFRSARGDRAALSKGRSAEISLEERFEAVHGDREKLAKGASADISLDKRFEKSRSERENHSKGRSADIPYSERKSGRDR